MALKLQAGTCSDPEGCGRAFDATECCVCPQCETLFCDDCWGDPQIHSACKRQDEIECAMATEEE